MESVGACDFLSLLLCVWIKIDLCLYGVNFSECQNGYMVLNKKWIPLVCVLTFPMWCVGRCVYVLCVYVESKLGSILCGFVLCIYLMEKIY